METIGGYRIIRKLGSGRRSEVYLGRAAPVSGRDAELAAIKVFAAGVSTATVGAEINALSRLRHPHVVRLLDLATGPADTPCLVLQRLAAGGLPALLAERHLLRAGEAVTILAPLAAAVRSMHRDGVSHGRLGASVVHFDGSGAPVLTGFGDAACFADSGTTLPDVMLESEPRVGADRGALLSLVRLVLNRCSPTPGSSVGEFIRWLGDQQSDRVDLIELEHRLFEIAAPVAVQFTDSDVHRVDIRGSVVPNRFGHAAGFVEQQHAVQQQTVQQQTVQQQTVQHPKALSGGALDSGISGVLSMMPPDIAAWISTRLESTPAWLPARVTTLVVQLRTVRRRVWVIASVGLIAVTAALVITGLPDQESSAVTPRGPDAPSPISSGAPLEDDPVVAAQDLLKLRARCLADRSILCLDAVDMPDSAAWQADAAQIRSVQNGGELSAEPFSTDPFSAESSVTVVDQLGQTVLLALAQDDAAAANATASVLMVRTEAGWRFRSLLSGELQFDGETP